VPLMLQVTSTKERGKWINQRAYYIYGLLTAGYAGAIMDWNGTGPGAAPGGDVFPEKRAARLLRARARDWNLSGRLGVTGHSKGSSRAGKAAFINEGNWEADRGPYAEQSDRFQVALLSAGQHAPEFLIEDGFHKPVRETSEQLRKVSTLTYMTPDDPPVFLSVGQLDREFRVKQMKRMAARCEEVGITYRLFVQKGMGHMYNPRLHWTDQKIRVHAFYCVAALTLVSLLRRELAVKGISISAESLMEQLNGIRETACVYPQAKGQPPKLSYSISHLNKTQKQLYDLLKLAHFRQS